MTQMAKQPYRPISEEFDRWWAHNHPWDWFAEERGNPLPFKDRLLVWEMCRLAFDKAERLQVNET